MKSFLKNFNIRSKYPEYLIKRGRENDVAFNGKAMPLYVASTQRRRADKYHQEQSFHTLDEAKYHVIQKYFEFIEFYKEKEYFSK
jgi:hypothetical protein